NLSNELGDVLRGTDTPDRQGPEYGLNGGGMTVADMKLLIGIFVGLCIVSGTAMTWRAFGTLWELTPILVLILGAATIAGAMKYTLGSNPYGYRAKGDFYVFLFFGLVAVLGAYFVCTKGQGLHWKLLLPAAAVGCFSVGVLNVNNIRDMKTDAANRVTVAIKLGSHKARIYQTVLIVLGWVLMAVYTLLCWPSIWHWLWLATLPLYIIHLSGLWSKKDQDLDPMLPLLVMATFLLCLLTGIGHCVYLF
ncbi:MAG: 1,4-dihydroxy-2-naphthoate octaprenyltransferase, partial [Clostridia bacterium]|nr:1,4-dihydroxy-2-naphthoate octaprenyltransferase [Clostridia bacterium]